jgi:hypothetical protein
VTVRRLTPPTFAGLTVTEVRPAPAGTAAPHRFTQRELVVASLLRCPADTVPPNARRLP